MLALNSTVGHAVHETLENLQSEQKSNLFSLVLSVKLKRWLQSREKSGSGTTNKLTTLLCEASHLFIPKC